MNVMLGALPTIALALSLAYSSGAGAQVGSTTDILMGRVAGLDSQAVAGARAEATSVESGITRTKTTGPDGRYTIIFPDGGGTYRHTVRALGMAPVTRNIQRQGDEDRITTDINMGRSDDGVLQAAAVDDRGQEARRSGHQRCKGHLDARPVGKGARGHQDAWLKAR